MPPSRPFGRASRADVAIDGDIAGAVDDAHAAVADLGNQLKARWSGPGSGVFVSWVAESPDDRMGLCSGHGIPFRRSAQPWRFTMASTHTGT